MSGTIYVQQSPDGTWVADVLELPGCMARGATRDEAVANVRATWSDYLALLRDRGVSTDHWKDLDPATMAVKDPPARFTFPEDFRPMEEHELRDVMHRMEASRAALLALVRGLSAEDIERKPTETTWSVREALEHVMQSEVGFLSKMEKWPDREFATLQAVHRMAFQRFTILEPADTALDHEIQGVRWSTRKVARRILEHEYEHLKQIRDIIAALGGDRQPS